MPFECPAGKSQENLMLIRLSTATAVICMLSGAALERGGQAHGSTGRPHRLHGGTTRYRGRDAGLIESDERGCACFCRGHGGRALDLVTKLKVTPEDNDTSRALTKAAGGERADLAKLSGADCQ